jgi:hypothetical protein
MRERHALGLSLLWSTALAAQKVLSGDGSNPLNTKLEDFVVEALEEWHVPGLAIAIVDGEDTWAAVSDAFSIC